MAEQLAFEIAGDLQPTQTSTNTTSSVDRSSCERDRLEYKYASAVRVNPRLDRTLVSFQANKQIPFYRWFKYREGFSAALVKQVISELTEKPGKLLDPFAGSGTALFAARELGWDVTGIELLPPGIFAIKARLAAEKVALREFRQAVEEVSSGKHLRSVRGPTQYKHIRITAGAFPKDTERELNDYLRYVKSSQFRPAINTLLRFAAFSILEEISYTRKDGQYLRWDYRSGRSLGEKKFNKGEVLRFSSALNDRLREMLSDLGGTESLFGPLSDKEKQNLSNHPIRLVSDSCLTTLPRTGPRQFDLVFTSPPYANRYDYTRTYALELAFLGCEEDKVRELRQAMLTCTVENREKVEELRTFYKNQGRTPFFERVMDSFEQLPALQEVLRILDRLREKQELNNAGIARLVRNYFLEMNLLLSECARVLKRGGTFVMVNDNVRYAGEAVPVDLILSEFAAAAGLETRAIWTLGTGKGNSSQQMGAHGRTEMRKSVCVWHKK